MPVSTRTTSADAGSHCPAQPAASMVARGQDLDPKENQPNKNNTTPQPYTPPPSALQRSRELKDKLKQEIHELEAVIDVQLSAAKEQYQRESAARSSARQRSRRHKPTPIKLPTLDDTMEDHGEQLPEQIGTAVSNAIASTLTKAKEETTGPYISKDAGAHIASDLAKPNRAGFTAEILKKSTLVEGKVKDLMTIKWNNREELSEALKELGLEHVDRRLAATIWCALTDKNKAPTVELLTLMTESDAALGQSGVLLLDWIAKEGIDGAYNKDEKEKALFDATVFFRAGAEQPGHASAIEKTPACTSCNTFGKRLVSWSGPPAKSRQLACAPIALNNRAAACPGLVTILY